MKNILSLTLFLAFFFSYITKLIILYKRDRIKANVLAKGHKVSDIKYTEIFVKISTLIWGAAWVFLSLAEPYIIKFTGKLTDSFLINSIGIIITTLGVLTFIQAMLSMKTSWRVGIDKSTETKLVTNGIYKYSRNPAFLGFDFMFAGLFLMYPSFITLFIFVLNILAIHLLILQEERHLKSMFANVYIQYCSKTPRYILYL